MLADGVCRSCPAKQQLLMLPLCESHAAYPGVLLEGAAWSRGLFEAEPGVCACTAPAVLLLHLYAHAGQS